MPDLPAPTVRRRLCAVVLAAAAAPLAGCGAAPIEAPPGEVVGGAIGPAARVGEDVRLLAVQLEHPQDGGYQEGEDAGLTLVISNTGAEADVLTGVTGPDFADVRSSDPQGGDAVAVPVPAGADVEVGGAGRPGLTLVDLDRSLRSSQSIPVTFTFRRAGEVTVAATVAAETVGPIPTSVPSGAERSRG